MGVSDTKIAKQILTWNNREKISMIGNNPIAYKWSKHHIEEFMKGHKPIDISEEAKQRLMDAATTAGTPGFLVESTRSAK